MSGGPGLLCGSRQWGCGWTCLSEASGYLTSWLRCDWSHPALPSSGVGNFFFCCAKPSGWKPPRLAEQSREGARSRSAGYQRRWTLRAACLTEMCKQFRPMSPVSKHRGSPRPCKHRGAPMLQSDAVQMSCQSFSFTLQSPHSLPF